MVEDGTVHHAVHGHRGVNGGAAHLQGALVHASCGEQSLVVQPEDARPEPAAPLLGAEGAAAPGGVSGRDVAGHHRRVDGSGGTQLCQGAVDLAVALGQGAVNVEAGGLPLRRTAREQQGAENCGTKNLFHAEREGGKER